MPAQFDAFFSAVQSTVGTTPYVAGIVADETFIRSGMSEGLQPRGHKATGERDVGELLDSGEKEKERTRDAEADKAVADLNSALIKRCREDIASAAARVAVFLEDDARKLKLLQMERAQLLSEREARLERLNEAIFVGVNRDGSTATDMVASEAQRRIMGAQKNLAEARARMAHLDAAMQQNNELLQQLRDVDRIVSGTHSLCW
jgi:hypothetical protein